MGGGIIWFYFKSLNMRREKEVGNGKCMWKVMEEREIYECLDGGRYKREAG